MGACPPDIFEMVETQKCHFQHFPIFSHCGCGGHVHSSWRKSPALGDSPELQIANAGKLKDISFPLFLQAHMEPFDGKLINAAGM